MDDRCPGARGSLREVRVPAWGGGPGGVGVLRVGCRLSPEVAFPAWMSVSARSHVLRAGLGTPRGMSRNHAVQGMSPCPTPRGGSPHDRWGGTLAVWPRRPRRPDRRCPDIHHRLDRRHRLSRQYHRATHRRRTASDRLPGTRGPRRGGVRRSSSPWPPWWPSSSSSWWCWRHPATTARRTSGRPTGRERAVRRNRRSGSRADCPAGCRRCPPDSRASCRAVSRVRSRVASRPNCPAGSPPSCPAVFPATFPAVSNRRSRPSPKADCREDAGSRGRNWPGFPRNVPPTAGVPCR